MAITHLGNNYYTGLTDDTKPTNVPNNSKFEDTQTGALWKRIEGVWVEMSIRSKKEKYTIYPVGSLDYKVKNNTNDRTVYTSSNVTRDALGAFEYCRDQIGNTSPGAMVEVSEGFFPLSAKFTLDGNLHRFQRYSGVGTASGFGPLSEIRAGISSQTNPNFPAIELDGSTNSVLGMGLDGLHLTHNSVGYSNGLVRILDTAVENTFTNLSFNDQAKKVGSCFSFEILNTTVGKSQYSNKILNCNSRGFDNYIIINNQSNNGTTNGFMSDLDISHCYVWNSKRVLKVGGVSGALVLNWHFDRVNYQHDTSNTVAANEGIFDYDSPVSCWMQKHTSCLIWDITAPGINYANVGSSTELSLIDCNPTFMIGGSGAYLNKVKSNEYYTGGFGPMNTGWISCTSTTPVGEGLLHAATTNLAGTPSVTQDSTGPFCSWATGTTQGTNTGPRRGPATYQMRHRPLLEIMASPSSTTLARCYYGIGNQVVLTDTDTIIGTTDSGIYAGWRSGSTDTNIKIFHHNGDGTDMTVIDTGLAKTTSLWKCAFLMDSTGFQWLVATPSGSKVSPRVTAKIPASTTNMAISAQAQNTTTTSINNQVRYVKLVLRSL